jgi:hypothetical protein
MTLTGESLKKADLFWATRIGCGPEDLECGRTIVTSPATRKDVDGAIVFVRGRSCVISVPSTVSPSTREVLGKSSIDQVLDSEFLAATFSVRREWVTSPLRIEGCDPRDFVPVPGSAQLLEPGWKQRVSEPYAHGEWIRSRFFLLSQPAFGVYQGDDLIAASGYFSVDGIADIRMGSHPSGKGKGHLGIVLSAALCHAFENGLLPMMRTEASDQESSDYTRPLGFSPYAVSCGISLTAPEL